MRRRVLFITHADVVIDPDVPVPDWPLSDRGRARHQAFNHNPAIRGVSAIHASLERKARDAAAILASATGLTPTPTRALHENDRSATGYRPRAEFEALADRFFAEPATSVLGWERAIDARARIVGCVAAILAADRTRGDIALVAHGGVGALLLSHLLRAPISRGFDQPGTGGGNWFAFDARSGAVIHGWRDIGAGPATLGGD